MTQRPPPQIVAGGFPARRASEQGSPLGRRRKGGRGEAPVRPGQGTALCELLERLPGHFAVLTAPTSGRPPARLGESGEAQETRAVSRDAVVVIVAAQGRSEDVLLVGPGSMKPVADEALAGLCRALEARALRAPCHVEVAWPMARAVVRAAHDAQGLWPSLAVLGGVSVGHATHRDEASRVGGQFSPTGVPSLRQPRVDAERLGSVLTAADTIIPIADPRGVALQLWSDPLGHPAIHHSMPVDLAAEHPDPPPLGRPTRSGLNRALRPPHAGVEPPAKARQKTGSPTPPWHAPQRPRMVQTATDVAPGGRETITDRLPGHACMPRGQGVGSTPSRPATPRAGAEVRRSDGCQNLGRAVLEGSIDDRGTPHGALCGVARCGDPHAPHGRRLRPVGLDPSSDLRRDPVQRRGDRGDGVSIDPRGPGLVPMAEMVSPPVEGAMVGSRGARQRRFPASVRGAPVPCGGHGLRPAGLWVQQVCPRCGGTVWPCPGACAADPCPLSAALPRSASDGSVRLPTARHERRAWRTLVSS